MCRNPLYFFSTVGAIGVGAQTGSIAVAAACAVIAGSLLWQITSREERFLAAKFGATYESYKSQVPAFILDRRLFSDPDLIEIAPRRLYGTLFDGLAFFGALPITALVGYLQDAGLLPVLFRLY